jgi:two-component system, chemotaxis family, chemotaxis protein CheY
MGAYRYDQLRVLVVDDNSHMRSLMATVLLAIGIRSVLEASDAEDGWKKLIANPCDIVFADWVMEGQSGLDFTRRLRTSPESPNPFIPVIMLSGHTSDEQMQAARDAGVNEFLAKPVSANTILHRLTSVIENPRLFVRTNSYFGPCRRRHSENYHGPERRTAENQTLDPHLATASAA